MPADARHVELQAPRRLRVVLAAVGVSLLVAATAAAGGAPGLEQVHLTAADQAAARAAVVTRSDLGPGWTGGAKKPAAPSNPDCGGYSPKQSDLVITGDAETDYKQPGLEIDSEAQVLRTARMVALDWQRSVVPPQVVPCLKRLASRGAPSSEQIVSVGRVSFPHVARYSAAFRIAIDVNASGSTVRLHLDIVLVGSGRTELDLAFTYPAAAAAAMRPAEVRIARLLASRAHA